MSPSHPKAVNEHSMHKSLHTSGETFPAGGNQQIFLTTVRRRSSVSNVTNNSLFKTKLHCLTNYGEGVKLLLGHYWVGWDPICCYLCGRIVKVQRNISDHKEKGLPCPLS